MSDQKLRRGAVLCVIVTVGLCKEFNKRDTKRVIKRVGVTSAVS